MSDFRHEVHRIHDEVHVTLAGARMTEEDAQAAILDFEAELPHQGSFEFHVHVGALAKYDGAARESWTRALGRHKDRCRRVVIHKASPLVRMAAATVALILRLPMDFEG